MSTADGLNISATRRLPGESGIWVVVTGDLVLFSIFFITLLYYRAEQPPLFISSQASLNQFIGALNTFLLLSSSLCIALSIRAARCSAAHRRVAPGLILAAMGFGLGFVIVKGFEWSERIHAGQTLNTNDFFIFYFAYTGIHLAHVIAGLAALTVMLMTARRQQSTEADLRLMESCGIFWHLVDLLWIILFALFYLLK